MILCMKRSARGFNFLNDIEREASLSYFITYGLIIPTNILYKIIKITIVPMQELVEVKMWYMCNSDPF